MLNPFIGLSGLIRWQSASMLARLTGLASTFDRQLAIVSVTDHQTAFGASRLGNRPIYFRNLHHLGQVFFSEDCLNMVRYRGPAGDDLFNELVLLRHHAGGLCQVLWLDFPWPDLSALRQAKKTLDCRLMVSLNYQASEEESFACPQIFNRLESYLPVVDAVMIDGRQSSLPFDSCFCKILVEQLARLLAGSSYQTTIGISGGLNQHNLEGVGQLLELCPELAIDTIHDPVDPRSRPIEIDEASDFIRAVIAKLASRMI